VIRTRQYPVVLTAAVLVGAVAVLYFARTVSACDHSSSGSVACCCVAQIASFSFRSHASSDVRLTSIAGAVGYVIFNQLLQVVNEPPSYRDNINNKLKTLRAPHKGALARAAENVKELGKELTNEATVTSPREGRLAGSQLHPTSFRSRL